MKIVFNIILIVFLLQFSFSLAQIQGASMAATQALYSSDRLGSLVELPPLPGDNNIEIVQIGMGNENITHISATTSELNLKQLGEYNRINLDLSAGRIKYDVLQTGKNNYLLEYAHKNHNAAIRRTVVQNGDKNNLTIHGRNSLSDNMSIMMNGGVSGIVIRNFN